MKHAPLQLLIGLAITGLIYGLCLPIILHLVTVAHYLAGAGL